MGSTRCREGLPQFFSFSPINLVFHLPTHYLHFVNSIIVFQSLLIPSLVQLIYLFLYQANLIILNFFELSFDWLDEILLLFVKILKPKKKISEMEKKGGRGRRGQGGLTWFGV